MVVFIPLLAFGQRDRFFETWTTISAQKKIKGINVSIEEGWRIREFYLSRQNYTDINVERKLNSFINVAGGYRISFKNSYVKYTEISNRFYFDVAFQYKYKKFSFLYRPRIQYSTLTDESDYGLFSQKYFRNKFRVTYKINKDLNFSLSDELFYYLIPYQSFINESRFSAAVEYEHKKHLSFSVGYMLRYYMQVDNPININILGVDVSYKF